MTSTFSFLLHTIDCAFLSIKLCMTGICFKSLSQQIISSNAGVPLQSTLMGCSTGTNLSVAKVFPGVSCIVYKIGYGSRMDLVG